MRPRSSGRSGQSCNNCITRLKSSGATVVIIPATSRTSWLSASAEDVASKDRQYDTKNISRKPSEQIRMKAAVIAGPPPVPPAPAGHLPEDARTRKPTPPAEKIQSLDSTIQTAKKPKGTSCAERSSPHKG